MNSKLAKGLNKKRQISQGSKLGRKAKANLKKSAASKNVPLIEKAFKELKIPDKVCIDGVVNAILEKKLDNRLSAQKNPAHIAQLQDANGQLANANTLGAKTVAPVLGTSEKQNTNFQQEDEIAGQYHEDDYDAWDNDLFRFRDLIKKYDNILKSVVIRK